MARHKTSHAANGSAGRGKPEIANAVHIQLAMLSPDEQAAFNRVINSTSQLRRLAKTADIAGDEGQFLVAEVTPELCLVFQITKDGARVVSIISKEMFDWIISNAKKAAGRVAPDSAPAKPKS